MLKINNKDKKVKIHFSERLKIYRFGEEKNQKTIKNQVLKNF